MNDKPMNDNTGTVAVKSGPPPRYRAYLVPTFANHDIVGDVFHIEFTADWAVFYHDHLDHTDVTAYPAHVVLGPIVEHVT